jgi:hypothetical protein
MGSARNNKIDNAHSYRYTFGFILIIKFLPKTKSMLFWDVNNGISRRSWARNEGAIFAIKRAMEVEPNLKVTLPNVVEEGLM